MSIAGSPILGGSEIRQVRLHGESVKARSLSNASEVYNIVKPLFAEQDDVEVFYGIFLDAANRILCIEKLCSGTLSSTAIYPREIVKKVLARQNLVKPANDMTNGICLSENPGMPSRPESAGGRRTSRNPW